MKKQDLNRKYNITDADFYVRCMETARYASRDIEEFKKHGYAAEKVTGFIAQCEKFRNMPDDDEMVGDQMIVTEKKYDAAETEYRRCHPAHLCVVAALASRNCGRFCQHNHFAGLGKRRAGVTWPRPAALYAALRCHDRVFRIFLHRHCIQPERNR